jgi:hypothetical protein
MTQFGAIVAVLALTLAGSAVAEVPAILAALDESTVRVINDSDAAAIRGEATQYVMRTQVSSSVSSLDPLTSKTTADVFLSAAGTAMTVSTTLDPYKWRYGYWGGAGWSNGEAVDLASLPVTTTAAIASATAATSAASLQSLLDTWKTSKSFVDRMDGYFWEQDVSYLNALVSLKGGKKSASAVKILVTNADKTLYDKLNSPALKNWRNPATGTLMYDNSLDNAPAPDAAAPKTVRYTLTNGKTVFTRSIPFSEYARAQALSAIGARIKLNYPVQ